MALSPRDFPLTREMVEGWLSEWQEMETQPPIKNFLAGKINDMDLPDHMVDTEAHESQGDETNILDLLMDDLPSYGYSG